MQKQECNKTNKEEKILFGTHEWATQTANFIDGCEHDCKYCYSKEMGIRFNRFTPDNWKNEKVRSKDLAKKFKKIDGNIMFPSSHDIQPKHLNESIDFLSKLLSSGNKVLIVTKPHIDCIKAICDKFSNYKNSILFRFTIGSANSDVLKFWEPGAPDFYERLEALKYSFEMGFQTSISSEPMLDNQINKLIDLTINYITDSIWLGKANFLLRRLKLNGINDIATLDKANELLKWQSDSEILKLYDKYKANPSIKWKESIMNVVKKDQLKKTIKYAFTCNK